MKREEWLCVCDEKREEKYGGDAGREEMKCAEGHGVECKRRDSDNIFTSCITENEDRE